MSIPEWIGVAVILCLCGLIFLFIWLFISALWKYQLKELRAHLEEEGMPEEEIGKRLKEAEREMLSGLSGGM